MDSPDNVAKVVEDEGGKERVLILRHESGAFALLPQYWYSNVYEGKLVAEGWASAARPASLFADVDLAEQQAHRELFDLVARRRARKS